MPIVSERIIPAFCGPLQKAPSFCLSSLSSTLHYLQAACSIHPLSLLPAGTVLAGCTCRRENQGEGASLSGRSPFPANFGNNTVITPNWMFLCKKLGERCIWPKWRLEEKLLWDKLNMTTIFTLSLIKSNMIKKANFCNFSEFPFAITCWNGVFTARSSCEKWLRSVSC